jgi:hypothetical protein
MGDTVTPGSLAATWRHSELTPSLVILKDKILYSLPVNHIICELDVNDIGLITCMLEQHAGIIYIVSPLGIGWDTANRWNLL